MQVQHTMNRFFSILSVLLACSIASGTPQSIQAFEIERLNYCSVTIEQDSGDLYTILVLKIKLPKILEQLNVIDFDCSI